MRREGVVQSHACFSLRIKPLGISNSCDRMRDCCIAACSMLTHAFAIIIPTGYTLLEALSQEHCDAIFWRGSAKGQHLLGAAAPAAGPAHAPLLWRRRLQALIKHEHL